LQTNELHLNNPATYHCMALAKGLLFTLRCNLLRAQQLNTSMPKAVKRQSTKKASAKPTFDPEVVKGSEKKVKGVLVFEHCVS
jgi:hypothetical protein